MDCFFHVELDKRLRICEESMILTKEHHAELAITLNRIEKLLSDHLNRYELLEREFNAFSWFRTQLNWMKDKLPWWCLTIIAIGITLLFVSVEGLKKIISVFK